MVVVSSVLPVAWILRLPLYIIALSFHLHYIGLISSYSELIRGGADSCHRPLLSVFSLYVFLRCWAV